MKLYYFKSDAGNFGDDLNPWLWQRLVPGLFDDNDDVLFVGIGTLLNHRIPAGPKKIVFGSGAGYGDKPKIDARWSFSCVRGPLTAQQLGLDPNLAITDAAALVSTVPLPAIARDGGIAFMPHYSSAQNADWESICATVGIRYIDSRWDVDTVLREVGRSEMLVTEAMHGAIIADTLRVPWVPVVCYEHILEFKWLDWTSSLDIDYAPGVLPGVWDAERDLVFSDRLKNSIKRGLVSLRVAPINMTQPPPARSSRADFDRLLESFSKFLKHMSPRLSDELVFASAVERLQEKLSGVCANYRR